MRVGESKSVIGSYMILYCALLILLFIVLMAFGHSVRLALLGVLCVLLFVVSAGIVAVSYFSRQSFIAVFKRSLPFSIFFPVSTFIFLLWLFAYFPACMSNDSFDQWHQARTLKFHNIHPYMHTFYITFFQRVFHTPAAVAVFQILMTSTCFSWFFHYFWKHNVSKTLLVLLFVLFCTSIPIGIYNITLWKDVPFSVLVILMAFFLGKKCIERKWSKSEIIYFIILALTVMLFRHNGIVYLIFLPIVLHCYFPQKVIRWSMPVILIALYFFFAYLIPRLLPIQDRLSPCYKYSVIYHASIGFYSHQPYTVITEKTRELLESAIPPEELRRRYNPSQFDQILYNRQLKSELFCSDAYGHDLRDEFLKHNLIRNLPYFIGDRINEFIALTCGYGSRATNSLNHTEGVDGLGLVETPLIPSLRFLFDAIVNPRVFWTVPLIWNQLFPIFLLLVLFVHSCYTGKKHFQIFAGILLVQLPVLMFFVVSADWRYGYCYYLAFFITLPMHILNKASRKS